MLCRAHLCVKLDLPAHSTGGAHVSCRTQDAPTSAISSRAVRKWLLQGCLNLTQLAAIDRDGTASEVDSDVELSKDIKNNQRD
jgi:hypothetical protein